MKRTFKITIELSVTEASVIEHIIGRVSALSEDAKIEVVEIVAVDKPEVGVVRDGEDRQGQGSHRRRHDTVDSG
jgi:hypothetical protein